MLKLVDFAERLFVVLIATPFMIAFARVLPSQPHVLLIMVSELLAVALVLVRRPGQIVASPYAFTIALLGTSLPLLIRPTPGLEILPPAAASVVMMAGLCLNISAKLFLNRSFGIVAANRGVKRGGPYRLVRHPMYLGYITTEVGYLLANLNAVNLALYGLAWAIQVLRIREEERFLTQDERYRQYAERVTYRLVPGVY